MAFSLSYLGTDADMARNVEKFFDVPHYSREGYLLPKEGKGYTYHID